MREDIIITVNEHSVRNIYIYMKKKNQLYAYSNNIMNHNNAEYVKELYRNVLISMKFSKCKYFY